MKIRTGTEVEFVRSTGIIPLGTTGVVRAVRHDDYLVEWNHEDPSRKGNLRNWHRSFSLRNIEA